MSVVTPVYGLETPGPLTLFKDLGAELMAMGQSIENVLKTFDYNGADPNAVIAQVTALNTWIKSGSRTANSDAARAAIFPAPAQGDTVFRTDKGWEERYYAAYNASTNPGGANPAGWYPVAGALPWATARKSGDQAVAAGDIILTIAAVDLFGGFTFTDNALVIPVTGTYEVSANIYIWATSGSYRGAQVVDGSNVVLSNATTNSNWSILSPKRRAILTAGTKIRLRTNGDASNTIRNDITPSLHVNYIGPAR